MTLTSFTADLLEPRKIPLVRMCEIYEEMGMPSLVAISPFVFLTIRRKVEGGVSPPPPSGRESKGGISTPHQVVEIQSPIRARAKSTSLMLFCAAH